MRITQFTLLKKSVVLCSVSLTFRFEEGGLITNLFLVFVEVFESPRSVPGLLDHHVLVQEELAVLVVVSGFLQDERREIIHNFPIIYS